MARFNSERAEREKDGSLEILVVHLTPSACSRRCLMPGHGQSAFIDSVGWWFIFAMGVGVLHALGIEQRSSSPLRDGRL